MGLGIVEPALSQIENTLLVQRLEIRPLAIYGRTKELFSVRDTPRCQVCVHQQSTDLPVRWFPSEQPPELFGCRAGFSRPEQKQAVERLVSPARQSRNSAIRLPGFIHTVLSAFQRGQVQQRRRIS